MGDTARHGTFVLCIAGGRALRKRERELGCAVVFSTRTAFGPHACRPPIIRIVSRPLRKTTYTREEERSAWNKARAGGLRLQSQEDARFAPLFDLALRRQRPGPAEPIGGVLGLPWHQCPHTRGGSTTPELLSAQVTTELILGAVDFKTTHGESSLHRHLNGVLQLAATS